VFQTADIKLANPATYAWWRTDRGENSAVNQMMLPFLRQMVRVFRDSSVRMLAGTDYYLFGLVAGVGLHRELAALVEAGLTPYQALETATRNPAESAGAGTVASGKVANLLVLDANPLSDIRNLSRWTGVVVRGRWLPAKLLDAWVDSLATSFVAKTSSLMTHSHP
jgi:adenine deaminase